MKIDFATELAADRRLCILRVLVDVGGSANDSVLQTALDRLGHRRLSRDTIRADLKFLAEHGCIQEEWLGPILVGTVTKRGVEVAEGRLQIDGIKKPAPGV